MREIEVKARIHNRMGFLTAAKRYGIFFSEPVEQDDTIYIKQGAKPDDPDYTLLRLRRSANKTIFTMKHKASENSKDNYEHETEVSDGDAVAAMLDRLGFVVDVRVYKLRQTAAFKSYEVCFDVVRDLGEFVEIEKLVEQADDTEAAAAQMAMLQIFTELGLADSARVHESYPTMIRNLAKQHK